MNKTENPQNYEEKIQRIQEIVELLETAEIPLEKNIELVKEGANLTKQCKNYLNQAELTINKILENETIKIE